MDYSMHSTLIEYFDELDLDHNYFKCSTMHSLPTLASNQHHYVFNIHSWLTYSTLFFLIQFY